MPRNQGQALGHLSQIISLTFPDSQQKILKFSVKTFPDFPWWWQPWRGHILSASDYWNSTAPAAVNNDHSLARCRYHNELLSVICTVQCIDSVTYNGNMKLVLFWLKVLSWNRIWATQIKKTVNSRVSILSHSFLATRTGFTWMQRGGNLAEAEAIIMCSHRDQNRFRPKSLKMCNAKLGGVHKIALIC